MTIQRLTYLCVEIYKTVNDLNLDYMKNIFVKSDSSRSRRLHHQNNLVVPRPNYSKFGAKSLKVLGPKIWNSLPAKIKSAETFLLFKKLINTWNGETCKCTHVSI